MKIIPKDKTERFANITRGGCFSFPQGGEVIFYMKTTVHGDGLDTVNSVRLDNGQLTDFSGNTRVTPLESAYMHTSE